MKESKKEKFKSLLLNTKEYMSNKRNKALVKLIIYFVFLTIVVIFIRVNASKMNYSDKYNNEVEENLPNTITEKLKNLNIKQNYQFNITYDIDSLKNVSKTFEKEINLKL